MFPNFEFVNLGNSQMCWRYIKSKNHLRSNFTRNFQFSLAKLNKKFEMNTVEWLWLDLEFHWNFSWFILSNVGIFYCISKFSMKKKSCFMANFTFKYYITVRKSSQTARCNWTLPKFFSRNKQKTGPLK